MKGSKKLSSPTTIVNRHSANEVGVNSVAAGIASQIRSAKVKAMLKAEKSKTRSAEKEAISINKKIASGL